MTILLCVLTPLINPVFVHLINSLLFELRSVVTFEAHAVFDCITFSVSNNVSVFYFVSFSPSSFVQTWGKNIFYKIINYIINK